MLRGNLCIFFCGVRIKRKVSTNYVSQLQQGTQLKMVIMDILK